jgi:hypothetical protein
MSLAAVEEEVRHRVGGCGCGQVQGVAESLRRRASIALARPESLARPAA